MSEPIIPEWFGCGNKLSFEELISLDTVTQSRDQKHKSADAGVLDFDEYFLVTSIDKIYQVGAPPEDFAKLAIHHAISDLTVTGCVANGIDICFQFSHQMTKESRLELSQTTFEVARSMGLSIGKCHSTFGRSTALIIACYGRVIKADFQPVYSLEQNGLIVLSGGLGGLSELYMSALEKNDKRRHQFLKTIDNIDLSMTAGVCSKFGTCTDVSGNALFGSAHVLSERHGKNLQIFINDIPTIIDANELTLPPCLYSIGLPEIVSPKPSETLKSASIIRELCGPIIFLINKGDEEELKTNLRESGWSNPTIVGKFNSIASVESKVRLV